MPSTNTDLINERFNEIRATEAARQVLKQLDDLSREPATKRFVRSRAVRKERWHDLMQFANQQYEALGLVTARAARPTVKKKEAAVAATMTVAPAPAPEDLKNVTG